jgi:hypothetical protein
MADSAGQSAADQEAAGRRQAELQAAADQLAANRKAEDEAIAQRRLAEDEELADARLAQDRIVASTRNRLQVAAAAVQAAAAGLPDGDPSAAQARAASAELQEALGEHLDAVPEPPADAKS